MDAFFAHTDPYVRPLKTSLTVVTVLRYSLYFSGYYQPAKRLQAIRAPFIAPTLLHLGVGNGHLIGKKVETPHIFICLYVSFFALSFSLLLVERTGVSLRFWLRRHLAFTQVTLIVYSVQKTVEEPELRSANQLLLRMSSLTIHALREVEAPTTALACVGLAKGLSSLAAATLGHCAKTSKSE